LKKALKDVLNNVENVTFVVYRVKKASPHWKYTKFCKRLLRHFPDCSIETQHNTRENRFNPYIISNFGVDFIIVDVPILTEMASILDKFIHDSAGEYNTLKRKLNAIAEDIQVFGVGSTQSFSNFYQGALTKYLIGLIVILNSKGETMVSPSATFLTSNEVCALSIAANAIPIDDAAATTLNDALNKSKLFTFTY
jgi:hypothetical protein